MFKLLKKFKMSSSTLEKLTIKLNMNIGKHWIWTLTSRQTLTLLQLWREAVSCCLGYRGRWGQLHGDVIDDVICDVIAGRSAGEGGRHEGEDGTGSDRRRPNPLVRLSKTLLAIQNIVRLARWGSYFGSCKTTFLNLVWINPQGVNGVIPGG